MLRIHKLFLESSNRTLCCGETIGRIISSTGRDRLWSERKSKVIDVVVIHYMSAVEIFPDSPYSIENIIPIFARYGVSSHFLITRSGKIIQLVPENEKAWHCGGSVMPPPDNRQNVNEFSIGIELLATAGSGFTASQYFSLGKLCCYIERLIGSKMTYVGHDQIAGERAVEMGLRDDRKTDPGPLFDWKRLYAEIERGRNEAL